jgi:hypothetical protein
LSRRARQSPATVSGIDHPRRLITLAVWAGGALEAHLEQLPLRALPGLGWQSLRKLHAQLELGPCCAASYADASAARAAAHRECDGAEAAGGVRVGELKQRYGVSAAQLKRVLGESLGAKVDAMTRGEDQSELISAHVRKSYSAEVNWGVRFEAGEEHLVRRFFQDIAAVLAEELRELGLAARVVGIGAKKRRPNAGMPYKMLGHGPCDSFSRSENLSVAAADADVLGAVAWR